MIVVLLDTNSHVHLCYDHSNATNNSFIINQVAVGYTAVKPIMTKTNPSLYLTSVRYAVSTTRRMCWLPCQITMIVLTQHNHTFDLQRNSETAWISITIRRLKGKRKIINVLMDIVFLKVKIKNL